MIFLGGKILAMIYLGKGTSPLPSCDSLELDIFIAVILLGAEHS